MADRTAAYGYMLPLATNAYTVPFDIRIRKRDIRTAYFNRIFHYISLSNCKSPTTNLTSINDSHGLDRYRSIRPRTNMDDFSPNPCGWLYFWSEIASTNIATLAELPARVRVPRGKIYSPFTGQMLSRGVQTSGWRERERERGIGGEEEGQSCCVWLNIRIHVLCCNE